ncbi:MAG: peptidylprolyl isomerase [Flavobacteriales bacterium]|nr:peptidylprolyl isomerase [Flavobacteriales bacterium]
MKTGKLIITVLTVFLFHSFSFAQNKNAAVLTVDGEPTTLEEFENIFRKNNRDSVITKQSLDDYMELFINFKLKVKEAREMGLDTVTKFKNELDGYRAQLARPYLTDTDMLNGLVKEAYEHEKYEVRAMHILIKLDPNALPADTLVAYSRCMALRERILAGEDFSTVARSREGSEDPSVKDNGGDLGYFTAFQMVYPFEEAAYNTPVGQVSMPVRTRYGYHLIKVSDKRPARGEIHVAHIMVKPKAEANGEQNAQNKITEIHQKLLSGEETFENLASKFSDDQSSAKKGGDLPWFGTGKMVLEFEDAAFALQKDGDFSTPVKTDYGWHIIKRIGYKPHGTYEEREKDLKSKVSKDGRSEQTRSSFVNKLKTQYKYTVNEKELAKIMAKADSNAFTGKLNIKKSQLKKTLYTIDGKNISVKEFNDYMRTRGNARPTMSPQEFIKMQSNRFGEEKLLAVEDSKLEEKHTPFRLLMKEYREGILLFELTDQKVWSKAVKDSAGLAEFYKNNASKYMWPERAETVIYTCANQDIAKELRKMLAQGMDKAAIAGELNKNSQLNLQIEEGIYAREDRKILGQVDWKTGISKDVTDADGQVLIADIKVIRPVMNKKLEEAKGLITSDYQTWLEQEWIKQLRNKHKYSVNKDVLYTIH